MAATWRAMAGGGSSTAASVASGRRWKGGNLQLRQPTLIISSVTETSRAIFGASPPFNFRYQHDAPSPRRQPRSLQFHLVISRHSRSFFPRSEPFLSRNQSRWLQQSRVLCPLTSSLAMPLATATRSFLASTMARLDRTWLVLYENLNMPPSLNPILGHEPASFLKLLSCSVERQACNWSCAVSHRSFSQIPPHCPSPRALHHIQLTPWTLLR